MATYIHQKAFEQLKKKLTSTPMMAYFDTKKRSLVIVDGSPYGISAILAQKVIEGLSLVWGIEHFRMFLIGSEFDVITDHKALKSIFNYPRSRPPALIDRWIMRFQPFSFKVIYRKGTSNEADYLSRHPVVILNENPTSWRRKSM